MTATYRLLGTVSLAWLAGCGHADGQKPAAPTDESIPVRVAEVREERVVEPITATGVVAARIEAALGFKIGGVVARVLVHDGDAVHTGQVLAELDTREIDAMVAKARAAERKAARDAARADALYRDSVATLAQAQDAATALDVARADVEAALVNRRYAAIVAGGPGVVLRRLAEPGQTLASGSPVLLVADARDGHVLQVGLTDRDAVRVHVGDSAAVALDAFPGRTLAARVRQVSGAASPVTGTVQVQLALDDAAVPERLVSGLVGRATIAPRTVTASSTVPVEAIVEADGASGAVYVLDASARRVHRVPVRVGALAGARVIVEGLTAGARVVTDGAAYLTDGAPVRLAASR